MRESVKMVMAGVWTVCIVFMITRLRTCRFLKRRTLVEKLRLMGL